MSISFPASLDTLTNPIATDGLTGHAEQHANVNDAIEAIEAKVGINASADTNSLDYKVAHAIQSSEKGAVSGVAPLGADSKVPSAYLPSYVDDVVEVANYAALPVTGEAGKIYVVIADETQSGSTTQYRWSGSAYSIITSSPGSTDAVPEGTTNLYFTAQRVRDAVLTGLSLASSAVVSATDSVLSAIGKLQAQITGKQDELVSGTNIKTINGSSVLGSGNLAVTSGPVEKQVIGISATASENHFLDGSTPNILSIKRGTPNAPGAEVLKVNAGVVSFPSTVHSCIRLNTANGYGSTNTKIRRFTNTVLNQGSDITYADSATLGASFTINTDGVYSISYNDQFNVASWFGTSLNASSQATSPHLLAPTEILSASVTGGVGWAGVTTCTVFLSSGSVVRANGDGTPSGGNVNTCQFTITRVA